MAKAPRAVVVWAALSLAGLGGGTLVYADRGLATLTANAAVVSQPAQSEPLITSGAAPLVQSAEVAGVGARDAVSFPDAAERVPSTSIGPDLERFAAARRQPPTTEPAIVVAGLAPMASDRDAAQASPPAPAPPQTEMPEARLPRPRPQPPLAIASIERRWSEIRALRNPARYPAIRSRFLYRHRLAPL
ncbi:MAG TPA: hypothetical protein VHG27_10190 [Xanthobacteraceae bacterium]|nr:hypothetical protein [Xanthobacteraceae bacterium]